MAKPNEKSRVVKVDSFLLEKVEEFISKKENRFKVVNKKQFVDLAIDHYLKQLKKRGRNEK